MGKCSGQGILSVLLALRNQQHTFNNLKNVLALQKFLA
jgi:hypothetical protein